ncbi:MAG: hypothetical protein ACK5RG_04555 [Cyclobacteriaceae bacterium]|jgi:hypothetical protein|nr:hypothetical protein [Flammeovirgaceae bacterium]
MVLIPFIKSRFNLVFLTGLLVTSTITGILYFTIPQHEYYGGSWAIYKPGKAEAEQFYNKDTASNVCLLFQLTKFAIIYWMAFGLMYFALSKAKRFSLNPWYVWLHGGLALVGFTLLIFLNELVISPTDRPHHLSDVYLSNEATGLPMKVAYQQILWNDAITLSTSIYGIAFCVIGSLVFLVAVARGFRKKSGNRLENGQRVNLISDGTVIRMIKASILSALLFFATSFITVLFQINSPWHRQTDGDLNIGFPLVYYSQFYTGDVIPHAGWAGGNLLTDIFITWVVTIVLYLWVMKSPKNPHTPLGE